MFSLFPALIALVTGAIFSGFESAFSSQSRLKLDIDLKRNTYPSNIISKFYSNSSLFLSTLWAGYIACMAFFSVFAYDVVNETIPNIVSAEYFSKTGILLLIILILGLIWYLVAELLSTMVFKRYPEALIKVFALPVYLIFKITYPLHYVLLAFARLLLRYIFRVKIEKEEYPFHKIDLDNLLDFPASESDKANEDYQEIMMFRNAHDLSNIKLREFMVPRNEIIAIEQSEDFQTLCNLIVESGHSKILVFDQTIDNITGYVHSYDIFSKPENITEILRPVIIVPGTMTADRLLNMFILERKSVALIVDEFGGTHGMLTIEDILEEIFGDIDDEYDVEQADDKQISATEYILTGRLDIDYINEKYNLNLPESDDYQTLAGYIIFAHQSIPAENEEIIIGNLKFTILKASESRIEQVHLKVSDQ